MGNRIAVLCLVRTVLTASRLLTPNKILDQPVVVVEDGLIEGIAPQSHAELPAGRHIALPESTLIPAFFDVHIHGSAGHDVMEATDSALNHIGSFLARRGVGAYCATTVTAPLDGTVTELLVKGGQQVAMDETLAVVRAAGPAAPDGGPAPEGSADRAAPDEPSAP